MAPQASAVASTLGKGVLAGKHEYPLLLLLLCFSLKTVVVRRFIEISCSGFRKGGKVAVQQEHTVNVEGAGQANSLIRTGRVHWTAFKCSVKGD